MQAMVYGIGPNPMVDEFEDDGIKLSPFNVYVCDKKTWTEKQHCSDDCVDQPLREKLGRAGFAESMESIFEPTSASMTEEEIRQAMEKLKFVYNEEFAGFMESAFG